MKWIIVAIVLGLLNFLYAAHFGTALNWFASGFSFSAAFSLLINYREIPR